jgi:hypothetical protein
MVDTENLFVVYNNISEELPEKCMPDGTPAGRETAILGGRPDIRKE